MEFLEQMMANLSETGALPLETIAGRVIIAAALGIIIGVICFATYRGHNFTSSFFFAQIILTTVGALILMIVGNNMARAFALMGALNLIRFSTRIEDPKDTALLFFSLGVGLACGSGLFSVALVGLGVITIILVALRFVKVLNTDSSVIEFGMKDYKESRGLIEEYFQENRIRHKLINATHKELIYKVFVPISEGADMANRIRSINEDEIRGFVVRPD